MNQKTYLAIIIGVILLAAVIIGYFWLSCRSSQTEPPVVLDSNRSSQQNEGIIDLEKSVVATGADVNFDLRGFEINLCTNDLPYQILDGKGNPLVIRHSCVGFVGHGVDQYCENGQVVSRPTKDGCSDAISCQLVTVNNAYSWNQKVYEAVTETCADQTIRREEPVQAQAGVYYILVRTADDQVSRKQFVIKEAGLEVECAQDSDCATGGCSGQLCGLKDEVEKSITTCEAREYYKCYQLTSCGCFEGQCQWLENANFLKCLKENI